MYENIKEMSKKELFEHIKNLREAMEDLIKYDPVDREDEDQTIGAFFDVKRQYNRAVRLFLRRIFKKRIFRVISF